MRLLHTSDWHLGRSLYGRKRYEEFEAFLNWLLETIEEQRIDTLVVAGDIFDTGTPSNRAQQLYYRFLHQAARSRCRHLIITAGNHDSPTFLDAPKELLRALNVHVVGTACDNPEDEVLVLRAGSTPESTPEAIVCAIPYLRDKDIRTAEPGETIDDKNAKLIQGVKNHYEHVCAVAERLQQDFEIAGHGCIPLIATGHLFTAGGKTIDGDGVRDLYVGTLAYVGKDEFPSSIDYLALGHLHVPQVVGGANHIRYSGSPLPMGYGEATQQKQVVVIEFDEGNLTPHISEVSVPCFQELVNLSGSMPDITQQIETLKAHNSSAWLEVEYTGSEIVSNLPDTLAKLVSGSALEVLRIKNRRVIDRVIAKAHEEETLDDLNVVDVFARCLDAFEVEEHDREELTASYLEIIAALNDHDSRAE